MIKNLVKILISILILFLIFIAYFSYFGIKTSKFNSTIIVLSFYGLLLNYEAVNCKMIDYTKPELHILKLKCVLI